MILAISRNYRSLVLVCIVLLNACDDQVVLHSPDAYPQRLSEWRMVWRDGRALRVNGDARTYDLNTSLFSDYALKFRTLYLPSGKSAAWHATESFDFPVGTIATKTFFYQGAAGKSSATRHATWTGDASAINFEDFHIMETRVLVRQPSGWDALAYIWDGDDAFLSITGRVIPMKLDEDEFPYVVPSRNECGSCHVTDHTAKLLQPIGLKARHLNREGTAASGNQLVALEDDGWLTGMPQIEGVDRNAAMHDSSASIEDRTRAYLDINCGHCHNVRGAADTSGLLLDHATTDARQMGRCKPTIAAGRGSGGRTFGIVPGKPDDSIMLWRMQTTDPGARMPELGRSLVHEEGVALVRGWIASQPGAC